MDKKYQELENRNKYLSDIINDMILALNLWSGGYEMDEEDPIKLRALIDRACVAIETPRTMEELAEMLGFDDEYIELSRQHDRVVDEERQEKWQNTRPIRSIKEFEVRYFPKYAKKYPIVFRQRVTQEEHDAITRWLMCRRGSSTMDEERCD